MEYRVWSIGGVMPWGSDPQPNGNRRAGDVLRYKYDPSQLSGLPFALPLPRGRDVITIASAQDPDGCAVIATLPIARPTPATRHLRLPPATRKRATPSGQLSLRASKPLIYGNFGAEGSLLSF